MGQDFGRVDWSAGADGAGPAWIVDREELVANPKAVLEVLEEWSSVCLGLEGPVWFTMPEAFNPASVDAVEAPDATFCDMTVKTVEFVKVPFILRQNPWTRLMVGVDVVGHELSL